MLQSGIFIGVDPTLLFNQCTSQFSGYISHAHEAGLTSRFCGDGCLGHKLDLQFEQPMYTHFDNPLAKYYHNVPP